MLTNKVCQLAGGAELPVAEEAVVDDLQPQPVMRDLVARIVPALLRAAELLEAQEPVGTDGRREQPERIDPVGIFPPGEAHHLVLVEDKNGQGVRFGGLGILSPPGSDEPGIGNGSGRIRKRLVGGERTPAESRDCQRQQNTHRQNPRSTAAAKSRSHRRAPGITPVRHGVKKALPATTLLPGDTCAPVLGNGAPIRRPQCHGRKRETGLREVFGRDS